MESIMEFFKSDAFKALAAALFLVFEFWAGRTDKIKSGSLLELILVSLKIIKPKSDGGQTIA